MHIRTTTDPINLREVANPESHPRVCQGDSNNSLEIYFENEEHRREYLALQPEDPKVICGDDSDDYVAEG